MQRVRLQKSANRRSNRGCLIVVPSRPSKRGQRAVAPRAAEVLEAVSSVGRVTALKHELLNRVAGLDRGQIATFDDKSEIALLAERLSGAMQNPVDPAKLAGRWQVPKPSRPMPLLTAHRGRHLAHQKSVLSVSSCTQRLRAFHVLLASPT